MTEPELKWLAEQAATRSLIIEVGSYLGRSTRVLCENTSGHVWAVDDWYGPRDVAISDDERRDILARFRKNLEGCEARLDIVSADHGNIEIDFSPDMVFIDGDHSYASARRDIAFWWEKLLPGGLLCGHDINMGGVAKACLEIVPSALVASDTTIWHVTKIPLTTAGGSEKTSLV